MMEWQVGMVLGMVLGCNVAGPGGSAGVTSSELSSTENQQYLTFGNPFQDRELFKSMSHQWMQLPNWKNL